MHRTYATVVALTFLLVPAPGTAQEAGPPPAATGWEVRPAEPAPAVAPSTAARGWTEHLDAAQGFRFDYPAGLFPGGTALPGGAGTSWQSSDGASRLTAFALPNPDRKPLERVARDYLREAGDPAVDYRARTRNGHVVVSGSRGDEIFYLRVARGRGAVHGVELRYPAAQERAFDPIVTRVSRSFRPGR